MQRGERPNGFGVTTAEKCGRRCVGLIYRRTSRIRAAGDIYFYRLSRDTMRRDWMRPTGIFLDFGTYVRVYGVPRNIIAVYVPGQFSQVVRLYSCIIIPKVIFQKTHCFAKRILPRESVLFSFKLRS